MKKTYFIFNSGRLERKDNTIRFTALDEEGKELKPRTLPIENVEDLYIFGQMDANSALYNFLGKKQVALHFFDYYENYTGSFMPKEHLLSGKLLIAQCKNQTDKKKRLVLAQKFVDGASHNMFVNLKYYNRREKPMEDIISKIDALRGSIAETKDVETLMGIEGNIRKTYYEGFDCIIDDFEMNGRSSQPPKNEVNSLISFGNMMCYTECLRAIHKTQLNPVISFLHSPGERRYSLSLDLAEIFKPVIVDKIIFKVLNKKIIRKQHFSKDENRILLKDAARNKFIEMFNIRLAETIDHPTLKRKVSYKHLMKLECYKLIKHIMKIDEYKPFKAKW